MSDNEKKDGVKYDEGKPPIYSGLVRCLPSVPISIRGAVGEVSLTVSLVIEVHLRGTNLPEQPVKSLTPSRAFRMTRT